MDSQDSLPPTDVIKAKSNDLAGAEPIGGDQEKHRIVTMSHGRRGIDGSQ